jgi:hypothetical protein
MAGGSFQCDPVAETSTQVIARPREPSERNPVAQANLAPERKLRASRKAPHGGKCNTSMSALTRNSSPGRAVNPIALTPKISDCPQESASLDAGLYPFPKAAREIVHDT